MLIDIPAGCLAAESIIRKHEDALAEHHDADEQQQARLVNRGPPVVLVPASDKTQGRYLCPQSEVETGNMTRHSPNGEFLTSMFPCCSHF